MENKKVCKGCGRPKDIVCFDVDKRAKDGFRSICKLCRKTENPITKNIHKKNPYVAEEILSMSKNHKTIDVKYFGFHIGVILHIRNSEYLAFSFTKGSMVCERKSEARAWLCQRIIQAGEVIKAGLMRKAKRRGKL